MKILIWFLCILANSVITAITKANGIILGGIPTFIMYMITFAVARTLCEKWEEHKNNKQQRIIPNKKAIDGKVAENCDKITFCRKCGKKLLDNSQFCSECGTEVVKGEN